MATQATVSVSVVESSPGYYYVASITLTNGGSSYTSASITFSAGGEITAPTATASCSNGSVSSVSLTGGGKYNTSNITATVSAPNVVPVNNTDLAAISSQLGLGGNMAAATNHSYINSNNGQTVNIGATCAMSDLTQLTT